MLSVNKQAEEENRHCFSIYMKLTNMQTKQFV